MKHQIKGRTFNRPVGPRLMLYRNLVTDFFRHGKIVTTEAKAREIKPMVEKIITLGKDNTVNARRQVLTTITDKGVVDKIFAEVAPKFKERNGGYTRMIKLGARPGDGAPTAKIELVE